MTRSKNDANKLVATVCGVELSFENLHEITVYLRWFENYAEQHRHQLDIVTREPVLRNRIAKLPAHMFKSANRQKVIKALKNLQEFTNEA